jgi:hypothetical protein
MQSTIQNPHSVEYSDDERLSLLFKTIRLTESCNYGLYERLNFC